MSLTKFNVQIEGRSFEIEIEDLRARPVVVTVDGQRFEVTPEESPADVTAHPVSAAQPRPGSLVQPSKPGGNGTSPAVVVPAYGTVSPPLSNGNGHAVSSGMHEVRSPLPGTIVSVAVRPGDGVEIGQELCALEAMKMKNLIRATRPGTIAEVPVSPGQGVKHQEVLVRYAD